MCDDPTPRFSGRAEQSVAREDAREGPARSVRQFRAADISRVMEILQEAPGAATWSRDSFLEAAEDAGSLALVLEEDSVAIGFLIGRLVRDQAEVLNLAVSRSRRQSGAGSALLAAALSDVRSRGGESVYLEVRESNTGAIAFYAKHGFAKVGRRKDYYQDPVEVAVTMGKKLAG